MKWRLLRGEGGGSAAAGEVLLRWGKPPMLSPGITIVCCWPEAGEPSILWCEGLERRRLSAKLTADACSCEGPEGRRLRFVRSAWWQPLMAAADDELVIPFQGWWHEHWYDSALLAFKRSQCFAAVAAGCRGWLEFDSSGAFTLPEPMDYVQFLSRSRGTAWRQSLGLALKLRTGPLPSARLAIDEWNARSASLLIALRVAHPETLLTLAKTTSLPSPGWKRLCQNLDIDLRPCAAAAVLTLDELWPEREVEPFKAFLRALDVPVVPEKLAASLVAGDCA